MNGTLFHPPSPSEMDDPATLGRVRAEMTDLRRRFLDRLACARVFDRDLYSSLISSIKTLRDCYRLAGRSFPEYDRHEANQIAVQLQNEVEHERDPMPECEEAYTEWVSLWEGLLASGGSGDDQQRS